MESKSFDLVVHLSAWGR